MSHSGRTGAAEYPGRLASTVRLPLKSAPVIRPEAASR